MMQVDADVIFTKYNRKLYDFQKMGYRFVAQYGLDVDPEIFRLRYKVFVEELDWLEMDKNYIEMDEFDCRCLHLCVYDVNYSLVGYLRIHPFTEPWMLDSTFSYLVSGRDLHQKNSCEVSRLAIRLDQRITKGGNKDVKVSDMLYWFLNLCCNAFHADIAYMVVSSVVYRHLKLKGLPILPKHSTMPLCRDTPLFAWVDWRRLVPGFFAIFI